MNLAPVWANLAIEMLDINGLVIAIMNATMNEAPGLKIEDYPTFILFPKDNKKGIVYEGEHNTEGFRKFLWENSSMYQAMRTQPDLDEAIDA